MTILNQEQIAAYHEQGYIVLRADEHKLVDAETLKQWTDEVASWPRVKGKWMPYNEITGKGESILMRTENFADYHDGFRELLFGDGLTGLLGQLTDDVRTQMCWTSLMIVDANTLHKSDSSVMG